MELRIWVWIFRIEGFLQDESIRTSSLWTLNRFVCSSRQSSLGWLVLEFAKPSASRGMESSPEHSATKVVWLGEAIVRVKAIRQMKQATTLYMQFIGALRQGGRIFQDKTKLKPHNIISFIATSDIISPLTSYFFTKFFHVSALCFYWYNSLVNNKIISPHSNTCNQIFSYFESYLHLWSGSIISISSGSLVVYASHWP